MTAQEILNNLELASKTLKYINGECDTWGEEQSYYDKAICDLLHYIQINGGGTAKTNAKLVNLIKEYRNKRQEVKNKIRIATKLHSFFDKQRSNDMAQKLNAVSELNEVLHKNPKYTPRVLIELFKEAV